MTKRPVGYYTWANMVQRCTNPKHPRYSDWGGRGITICDEWRTFEGFQLSMGDRPEGLTIERRDNNKGYSPDNCRWATTAEQNVNQRLRKDNSSGERNISPCYNGFRVNIYRGHKRYQSTVIHSIKDAVELRDFALEIMNAN